MPERFGFAHDPRYRPLLNLVGVRPGTAWVEIDDEELRVRYGRWRLATALTNVESAEVTGPYTLLRGLGARLSVADRGVTFSTSLRRGVCLRFRSPVPGLAPGGLLRHPGATLTVAEPAEFMAALRRHGVRTA